jgi:hypothetical protein
MEAKELRIGNFVRTGKGDREFKVDYLFLFYFKASCVDSGVQMVSTQHNITPIPLTEEWLLKFGFEKGKLQKWFGNGHDYQPVDVYTELYAFTIGRHEFEYHIRTWTHSGIAEDESCAVYCGDNLVVCEHVHQLQNLYFALTGEELETK